MLFTLVNSCYFAGEDLRGNSNEPLEVIGEVALVKKTDLVRDLCDAHISPQEQAFGALKAGIEHISMRGHSCDLFKRACEMISAHISNKGEFGQCELLAEIVVDIRNDMSQCRGCMITDTVTHSWLPNRVAP
jgi:hypothetical protein